jgi:hypothetical protein
MSLLKIPTCSCEFMGRRKSLGYKVWFMIQQQQHHLGAVRNVVLALSPHLLNQNLYLKKILTRMADPELANGYAAHP